MATIFTHPIIAVTLGRLTGMPPRTISIGCLLSILPDIDFVAFYSQYGDWHAVGHRGFTHSLAFALFAGVIATRVFTPDRVFTQAWWQAVAFFTLCMASHGMIDACTDGGAGIAFFWPLSDARFFFPWNPIQVSPIGLEFLQWEGVEVLLSEFLWVWIPSLVILAAHAAYARWFKASSLSGLPNESQ